MSGKKLLIYFALLCIVAGLWAVFQFLLPAREGEDVQPPLFGGIEEKGIQEIAWKRGGEHIVIKKNKEWEIVQPIQAKTDPWIVDSVLRTLSGLKAERRYSGPAGQGREFGLDPPRLIITLLSRDRRWELWVGNKNPTSTYYYARIPGAPELLLISDVWVQDLDRSLFDLRDKRVFSLALDRIGSVEVQGPKQRFLLEKTGEGWRAKNDPPMKLNTTPVETFLNDLLDLKAQGFVATDKEDPGWGLTKPLYVIRLISADPQRGEERLALGKEEAGKGLYARSTRQKDVFYLNRNFLSKIPKTLEDWKFAPPPSAEKKGP